MSSAGTEYFGCAETPIWMPELFDISAVPLLRSTRLRLTAPASGPANVAARVDGLLINENPLVTFTVNGIQNTLAETLLLLGGAHRLPGAAEPGPAELVLFFRDTNDWTRTSALCFPVAISESGRGTEYFVHVGAPLTRNAPTVASVVDPATTFLTWRGADVRGRSAASTQPSEFCDPVRSIVTYYVATRPINIKSADHARLVSAAGAARRGPPRPVIPAIAARLNELASRITGITVEDGTVAVRAANDPGIPTSSLKCFRLNPDRDIKDNKVYVGGAGLPFNDATRADAAADVGGIPPGDIQRWLGIIVGVVVGVVVCAFIAVGVWKGTFTKYLENSRLYKDAAVSVDDISSVLPTFKLPTICPPAAPAGK